MARRKRRTLPVRLIRPSSAVDGDVGTSSTISRFLLVIFTFPFTAVFPAVVRQWLTKKKSPKNPPSPKNTRASFFFVSLLFPSFAEFLSGGVPIAPGSHHEETPIFLRITQLCLQPLRRNGFLKDPSITECQFLCGSRKLGKTR